MKQAMISVVINTRNEEKNLPRAIASIRGLADEIVVVDMESEDKTAEIAKKAGARIFLHKPVGYVEPARNFAISKATGGWILILDADEEISESLAKKLKKLAEKPQAEFYRLPRKNIIFGKWIKHTGWWPDYNIRFFKKGAVQWSEVIHSVPETRGDGMDLPQDEEYAIIHHNYQTVLQYLERMIRYTDIQAKFLIKDGYKFSWQDLVRKPTAELLGRFFANEGYKDGVHGLALSILQGFSEFVVYLRVWEHDKFKEKELDKTEIDNELTNSGKDITYWLEQSGIRKRNLVKIVARKLLGQ